MNKYQHAHYLPLVLIQVWSQKPLEISHSFVSKLSISIENIWKSLTYHSVAQRRRIFATMNVGGGALFKSERLWFKEKIYTWYNQIFLQKIFVNLRFLIPTRFFRPVSSLYHVLCAHTPFLTKMWHYTYLHRFCCRYRDENHLCKNKQNYQ